MQEDSTFVAIDVETGETLRHVLGVGVAEFRETELEALATWQSRIDPETEFSRTLRLIDDVTGQGLQASRTFPQIHPILEEWLAGRVVVAHGDHARRALDAACERYGLAPFDCRWVDSHALARTALVRRREEQYRLESLAAWLGLEWSHHELDRRATVTGRAAMWCAAILGSDMSGHSDDGTATATATGPGDTSGQGPISMSSTAFGSASGDTSYRFH